MRSFNQNKTDRYDKPDALSSTINEIYLPKILEKRVVVCLRSKLEDAEPISELVCREALVENSSCCVRTDLDEALALQCTTSIFINLALVTTTENHQNDNVPVEPTMSGQ